MDITIVDRIPLSYRQRGRAYYYQGNVFQPLSYPSSKTRKVVERKIRIWLHQNRERVRHDRAQPGYKTLSELADD